MKKINQITDCILWIVFICSAIFLISIKIRNWHLSDLKILIDNWKQILVPTIIMIACQIALIMRRD